MVGKILEVINDRNMWNATDGNYDQVILSWNDYYAFGMTMPGRNGGVGYRYQFNGMETDNEISGKGNSYTTEFRQYDPRLGRWKSLDPLMSKFPHMSPYVAFNNNPVYFVDPYGLEGTNPDGDDGGNDGGGDEWDYGSLEDLGDNLYKTEDGRFLYKTEDGYSQLLRTVEVDPSNKASYQHLKESSNISSVYFYQLYKQYRWDRYDGNYVDFNGSAMHRRLQEQFDLVVWDNTVDLLNGFGVATVIAASGGALAPAALEIGGALLSTLPELEAIITYYYITAEAAYFNTVYTLSKYVAGRVLIYTTSIMIGTSTPSMRSGGPSMTQTLYSRGSTLRAPVGGVKTPDGSFVKGGRFYSGPRFFFQRNAVNIPDPGVLNPWEPWPRNTMIDVAGRRPWLAPLSNPWIRGGAVGLGSYGAYKHMELEYKLRNE
ncbi:hypothetical protein GCM10009118_34400 [Wandonia haliotis]|uniref:RHS repeat-associated core domain-containing protein n=1 Tax=Wandonia haliotis TaxID=574963 RepID=A0ABN1MUJ0_9FLAO